MSTIAGILNINDTERNYVGTVGQSPVFDAVNKMLADRNAGVALATSVFVEKSTEDFAKRYLLAGGGRLQQMGRQAPAAAIKRSGYYDVGFQLRQWGAESAGSRVDMAYMSIAELQAHVDTIMIQDANTMRHRILTALFENTNLTWPDPIHGNVTVRRLANTDGTLFPPVLGSETEADDEHYHDAAYTVAQIADANNPALTLRNEIAEHFGGIGSSGKNFVYFHGADQTAYLAAITGYVAVPDQYINFGVTTDTTKILPNVPGRVHGRVSGVWLSEWDGYIPDEYGMCILVDVAAPLQMRLDPSDTGLGSGLQLVATDNNHPMHRASYENRYGFGVGNRLSAAIIEINNGGATYTPPSAYAE